MIKTTYFIVLFCFLLLSISCEKGNLYLEESKFNTLCNIYKNIASKNISVNEKETAIYNTVKAELPDFFKDYFDHISNTDRNRKYSFTQEIASARTNNELNWECGAMKEYYENT
ncbi:MAG: hypothetical protein ACRBCI_11025 [Cellvibrionaceae bacterium]